MAGITARFKRLLLRRFLFHVEVFMTSAVPPDLGAAAQRLLTLSEETGRTDVSPEGSLVQYSGMPCRRLGLNLNLLAIFRQ
jgi:hypothetical protein